MCPSSLGPNAEDVFVGELPDTDIPLLALQQTKSAWQRAAQREPVFSDREETDYHSLARCLALFLLIL